MSRLALLCCANTIVILYIIEDIIKLYIIQLNIDIPLKYTYKAKPTIPFKGINPQANPNKTPIICLAQ